MGQDLISSGYFFQDEPRYQMARPVVYDGPPTRAELWEEQRTVYTTSDPEKQAEMREEWEAAEHRAARSSVLPLSHEDEAAGYVVDDTFRRSEKTLEQERVGIGFEYRRRDQGRQPWMSKHSFKHFKDCERQQQRQRIVSLVEQLGGDPRSWEVGEWVKRHGYQKALEALESRFAAHVTSRCEICEVDDDVQHDGTIGLYRCATCRERQAEIREAVAEARQKVEA